MKDVYIVLSMSGTKFSKFLKFFLKSEFTHVSLSFDKNIETLHSFGRKKYYTPWIAGYTEEHPYTGIFNMFNSKCEILDLQLPDNEYDKLRQIITNVSENNDKYKYNFRGLLLTYFNKPQKLNRKFTCTQFVANALDKSGVHLPQNKDASLFLPADYYQIDKIKSIYRGRIKNYFEASLS